jgi:hypothetical protein
MQLMFKIVALCFGALRGGSLSFGGSGGLVHRCLPLLHNGLVIRLRDLTQREFPSESRFEQSSIVGLGITPYLARGWPRLARRF